jgi:hypothetical protein
MKSFKQFSEALSPDSPQLILGKMGVPHTAVITGPDSARVREVQHAEKNKVSPYSGKIKPNKRGNPKT